MPRTGKRSQVNPIKASRPKDSFHPALKLRHTLRGHAESVYRMALSPDGQVLASPSKGELRLWDVESGQLLRTIQHPYWLICVTWSPDGKTVAGGGGGEDNRVYLWDISTGQQTRIFGEHDKQIWWVAWSPNGKTLASCSEDNTICFWNTERGHSLGKLRGHPNRVEGVAWSPDGRVLCSVGRNDQALRFWDAEAVEAINTLTGHSSPLDCVAWSPGGQEVASGSHDQTVRIWDLKSRQQKYVLEGHTETVVSVCYLDNGNFLASLGEKGAFILWQTDTWGEVMRIDKICAARRLVKLAGHHTLPVMATPGPRENEINIWTLDFTFLRGAETNLTTVYYVNAKAVLLGDSGVGKSGLGIRIAEGRFRKTDSTHGAQFWHFPTKRLTTLPVNVQAELTLWDLAGQPEYRLTHQLFLDDTDAALLLFDCSDPDNPFHGVLYWAKVLDKLAPKHALKYLVSARCDVSPVTADRREINCILAQYGLDAHFKTSAKEGKGVETLFEELINGIPWDRLPRTSTPRLFQAIREFLLERKEAGGTLLPMDEIQRAAEQRFSERIVKQAELDTVVQLLQSRGLVFRLDPRANTTWVLLKPDLINQYGSSIIRAARNHSLGIGAVAERDILIGDLDLSGCARLSQGEEALVLEATAELLIRSRLGFREMGYLVFPSQINVTRLSSGEMRPRTEVAYRFSGGIETIYASLVVRLSYTDYFRRESLWKHAVEFSRDGSRLGFSIRQIEEGTGELEIYFYPEISEFDRVTFIRFVTDHLRAKGIDIEEQIRLYCPDCSEEVTNREAIEVRVQRGFLDVPCQYCATAIVIPESIEERYRRDPLLGQKQKGLAKTVEKRTEAEVVQLRADRQQYTDVGDPWIHILHLSDLHLQNSAFTDVYRTQLDSDLIHELGIRRLHYLVISGDIGHHSTKEEYRAAFAMVDGLVKRFGLNASRVVVVPGNHDVNWRLSKRAYPFVYQDDLPASLPEDCYIPAGEAGALVRDDDLYRRRFAHFNSHFYRRVYTGQDYPLEDANQALLVERPEDRILFLGLNSCWQIDHHYKDRASIHMPALSAALDRLLKGNYDGWLKFAVWHHPVTGQQMMNDEFMELLAVHGFEVCLHGHIHEAIEDFHGYDEGRGLRIVGAGTFGAPAREQTTGIPLQYNVLTFDPQQAEITVHTRKREKPSGAWSADARWGDKNNPKPRYSFQLRHYQPNT